MSVNFFTLFIKWFIVSSGHRVFWWDKIQAIWVLGRRDILHVMTSMSCHGVSFMEFQRCLAEPSGVFVCSFRTCACCSGGAGQRRQKSLTRWWLLWTCWVGHLLCRWGASQSGVGEIQLVDRWAPDPFTSRYLQLFHCGVSHGTSVKVS